MSMEGGRPTPEPGRQDMERVPFRLVDHIGMISGGLLAAAFIALLVVLAIAGDPSAVAVLVVIFAGIALIYILGQMHGPR
ncbi:MAG TPA: hypothetical protein VEH29_15315, partial [Acidimicrobiales bacterium]|nr:hypothetical protein [Acidimicrobiales bacterium]